jgi:hypothetical protein
MNSDLQSAMSAHSSHEMSLIARADVVGIGVGHRTTKGERTDEPCLKVFVVQKLPSQFLSSQRLLPPYVPASDGTPVRIDVEEMASLLSPPLLNADTVIAANHAANEAFQGRRSIGPAVMNAVARIGITRRMKSVGITYTTTPAQTLQVRRRPAPGGVSIAHFQFSTGTLTTGVRDRQIPEINYVLSCNHVLALASHAHLGDPILQPARSAGGVFPRDFIANLARFVPADPMGFNLVDGAVAVVRRPLVDVGEVAGLGRVRAVRPLESLPLGEPVRSVGSATGMLEGHVLCLNATLKVNYAAVGLTAGIFLFRNQILTTPMSAFGDSGALLLDHENKAVGMLFTGSISATGYNPIEEVQQQLGILVGEQGIATTKAATQPDLGHADEIVGRSSISENSLQISDDQDCETGRLESKEPSVSKVDRRLAGDSVNPLMPFSKSQNASDQEIKRGDRDRKPRNRGREQKKKG